MSMTAVIGLGLLAWVLLAILVALAVARMIRIRDRQRLDRTDPASGESAQAANALPERRRWRPRSKA